MPYLFYSQCRLFRSMVFAGAIAGVVCGGFLVPAAMAMDDRIDMRAGVEGALEASFGSVSDYIHDVLENDTLGRGFFKDRKALQVFYQRRSLKPYWSGGRGDRDKRERFVAFIEDSWSHGLNPGSYHIEDIQRLMDAETDAALADLDLLLSDAYVRLGQDLTGIRVDPLALNTRRSFWRKALPADVLLFRLGNDSAKDVLDGLSQKGLIYTRVRQELRDIVTGPVADYERVLPIHIRGILRPNERHERVIDLRLRLGVSDEVDDPYLYDDALAAEIIRFQRRHALKPDGLIGGQTLDVLNISREQKIRQLIANLERLRWVDESRPDKFVVVNIPSATLWAVEDGELAFEMPVIVGRKKRPTNMFVSDITGVRFNPNWTVPYTIKREDILPALREDPEYLTHKGMELLMGSGEDMVNIDPVSIDWASMSEDELKYFRMVQIPGGQNPLGRVRILMPNRYNIYLHDTNKPHYFDRASRALSSGCVRLKEPEKMAEFIMKERSGWSGEVMQGVLEEGDTRDLYIPRSIPVYLLYYTVWINERDEIIYGHDLYGYDKTLIKMLSKLDGIFIPVDNNEDMRSSQSFALN